MYKSCSQLLSELITIYNYVILMVLLKLITNSINISAWKMVRLSVAGKFREFCKKRERQEQTGQKFKIHFQTLERSPSPETDRSRFLQILAENLHIQNAKHFLIVMHVLTLSN